MKKILVHSFLLVSMIFLSGCSLSENIEVTNTSQPDVVETSVMMRKEATVVSQAWDAMMQKETGYVPYTEPAVDAALAQGKKVTLFFYASWCPTCQALDANLRKETIPADVVIFQVNYDDAVALKKKYGVTLQHTLVAIDAQKNMIKKEIGSKNIADIVRLF